MFPGARFTRWLLTPVLLMLATGCSQFNLARRIPWLADTLDGPRATSKVSATWTETVRYQADQAPVRGFGGRLMFFGDRQNKPVRVKGDLVVYAFDERDRPATDSKPTRKYVFPAKTLEKLYSKSDVGHSYSVWVPWDDLGGPEEEISLIVRFKPTEGVPVLSDQTKLILSGKKSPPTAGYVQQTAPAAANPADARYVQSVSYDQTAPSGPAEAGPAGEQAFPAAADAQSASTSRQRMQTTTIHLTQNFGRHTPVAQTRSRKASPERPASKTRSAPKPWSAPTTRSQAGSYDLRRKATAVSPQRPNPPRPTRYSLSRSRPLGAPIARLTRDHEPWQPRPVGWRSHSQPAPGPVPRPPMTGPPTD